MDRGEGGVEAELQVIWLTACTIAVNGSVQFSRSVVSDSLRPHELQRSGSPCPCALQQILISYLFYISSCVYEDFPGGASGKEPACRWRRPKKGGFHPWVGKMPWRRAQQPTPVFLPGKPLIFAMNCHGI